MNTDVQIDDLNVGFEDLSNADVNVSLYEAVDDANFVGSVRRLEK